MSTRTSDLILAAGEVADRPLPAAVPAGSLYPGLDTGIIYRNNDDGTAWEDWLVVGDLDAYLDIEAVRDAIVAMLVAGTGVTLVNDDAGNTLTINATLDAEVVRDSIGAALVEGTGIDITVDDAGNTITITSTVTAGLDTEAVRDLIGTTLVEGDGVTITVDDSGNTVTIDADGAAPTARDINAQTGTGYTLVLADAGRFVTMTNAGASTLTVPPNSGEAFPVGTFIDGAQLGAGQVTLTAGSGVTINASPGLKVAAQYGTFGLLKTATNVWLAYGRLAA